MTNSPLPIVTLRTMNQITDAVNNQWLLRLVQDAIAGADPATMAEVLCLVESEMIGDPLSTARHYTLEEIRDGRASV